MLFRSQAIATMVALRNQGSTHFVVVCPASVLINWCREIEKFCDIKVIHNMIRGKNTSLILKKRESYKKKNK